MKYIFSCPPKALIGVFLGLVLGFSSCDSVLDDYAPYDTLTNDVAITTTANAQAVLVSAYDAIQSYYVYGGQHVIAGDLIAEEMVKTGKGNTVFEEDQLITKTMSDINLITAVMWSDGYRAINRVNNVLAALETITDSNIEANRSRLQGEAKFIRGITMFLLLQHYKSLGQNLGVILKLTPSLDINDRRARSSIADSFAQIIADLEDAVAKLPTNNSGRATSWAAKAFLARVNFYKGDLTAAGSYANDLIENSSYSLDTTVTNQTWTNGSPEVIFALKSIATDANNGLWGTLTRTESGRFGANADFYTKVTADAADRRAVLYELSGLAIFINKYKERDKDLPLIRLAEMYLTRSEARLAAGDEAGALSDLNTIRARAGLAAATADNLADKIFEERRLELAFEGDYFHNLRRLEKNIAGFAWNSPKLVMPIPRQEIENNPNCEQNTGY